MSNLTSSNNETMTHNQLAELTNKRPDNVKRTIESLSEKGVIRFTQIEGTNLQNKNVNVYHVSERDSYIVVAQLSPEFTAFLVDAWQERKKPKPMSHLEVTASLANGLVEHEKKLAILEEKSNDQQKQIESLVESSMILPAKPANAESITYIRARINRAYGLPPRIVNEVLYSIHYSPKPAGQVRNTHEQASNSTYTVWNTSEVTKLFKRFSSECEMTTRTQAVHPSIDGKFKLVIL